MKALSAAKLLTEKLEARVCLSISDLACSAIFCDGFLGSTTNAPPPNATGLFSNTHAAFGGEQDAPVTSFSRHFTKTSEGSFVIGGSESTGSGTLTADLTISNDGRSIHIHADISDVLTFHLTRAAATAVGGPFGIASSFWFQLLCPEDEAFHSAIKYNSSFPLFNPDNDLGSFDPSSNSSGTFVSNDGAGGDVDAGSNSSTYITYPYDTDAVSFSAWANFLPPADSASTHSTSWSAAASLDIVLTPFPALSAQFVAMSPQLPPADPGETIMTKLRISDGANAAAVVDAECSIAYYLDPDPDLGYFYDNSEPIAIGATVLNLQAGDSSYVSMKLKIPNDIAAGAYSIWAVVDSKHTIVPLDPRNSNAGYVIAGGPSLTIVGVQPIVSGGMIAPTAAPALTLGSIFGGEQLAIPLSFKNLTSTDESDLAIQFGLSASGADAPLLSSSVETFSGIIPAGGSTSAIMRWTVPFYGGDATPGESYHIVVRVLDDIGEVADQCATTRTFEFLGYPTYADAFANSDVSLYFESLRALASGDFIVPVGTSSYEQFLSITEGSVAYAYVDSVGKPTIGIGVNLSVVNAKARADLVNSVARMVAAKRITLPKPVTLSNPASVITWLEATATGPASKKKPAQIDQQGILNSFADTLIDHEGNVANALGISNLSSDSYLTDGAKIALVDLDYNVGNIKKKFPALVSDLSGPKPDYAKAAFDLMDAEKRSALLPRRTQQDFEELLFADPADYLKLEGTW